MTGSGSPAGALHSAGFRWASRPTVAPSRGPADDIAGGLLGRTRCASPPTQSQIPSPPERLVTRGDRARGKFNASLKLCTFYAYLEFGGGFPSPGVGLALPVTEPWAARAHARWDRGRIPPAQLQTWIDVGARGAGWLLRRRLVTRRRHLLRGQCPTKDEPEHSQRRNGRRAVASERTRARHARFECDQQAR